MKTSIWPISNEAYVTASTSVGKTYGLFCALNLILAGICWSMGRVSVGTVIILAAYLAFNMVFTLVAPHFRPAIAPYLEGARIFGVNGVMAPLAFLAFDGDFSRWWYAYVIGITGGTMLLGANYKSKYAGYVGIFYWLANFTVATYWGLPHPDVIQFAFQGSALFMLGVIFLHYNVILSKSIYRENRRTQELEMALGQLKETQSQLTQSAKFVALGEMAGGVAHEINNPLAVIKLSSDLIRDLVGAGASARSSFDPHFARLNRSIERISNITHGLVSFSRNLENEPSEDTVVKKIFEMAASFCAEKFSNAGVELRLKDPGGQMSLRGRKLQITQILLNLLNNAYDVVQKSPEKWIALEAIDYPDRVDIVVTDSGRGISTEVASRMFQPLFTTKELGKGAGLGLSTARGLAESNRGTLSYDPSFPNTRFILSLPKSG